MVLGIEKCNEHVLCCTKAFLVKINCRKIPKAVDPNTGVKHFCRLYRNIIYILAGVAQWVYARLISERPQMQV